MLITDARELIRVNPTDGRQTVLTTLPAGTIANAVAVRSDGAILLRTNGDAVAPRLVKVDPATGGTTTISIGNFLNRNLGSRGLSMENGIFVVSAENGTGRRHHRAGQHLHRRPGPAAAPRLQRGQRRLGGRVNQIPPTRRPVAANDTFSMPRQDGQLHVLPPGVLANDRDPLGQPMTAQMVGSTTAATRFVSFFGTGEFFYFPDPGFVGTETFTYRTVAGGRAQSTPPRSPSR